MFSTRDLRSRLLSISASIYFLYRRMNWICSSSRHFSNGGYIVTLRVLPLYFVISADTLPSIGFIKRSIAFNISGISSDSTSLIVMPSAMLRGFGTDLFVHVNVEIFHYISYYICFSVPHFSFIISKVVDSFFPFLYLPRTMTERRPLSLVVYNSCSVSLECKITLLDMASAFVRRCFIILWTRMVTPRPLVVLDFFGNI